MVEEDLGEATIVYEDPEEGTVEQTVENEHIAYFQDHWIIKTGEDEGLDTIRRIPYQRVYYVERSVEEFQEEVKTLTDRVQSVADEVRSRLGGGSSGSRDEPHTVEIGTSNGDEDNGGTDGDGTQDTH